ncbi:SdrD B-like domain-containing protein [Crystallibacter crystallopoietes]|nr:SdrD B-like domain-containing protein [Arthrobacter crystallopoietes]
MRDALESALPGSEQEDGEAIEPPGQDETGGGDETATEPAVDEAAPEAAVDTDPETRVEATVEQPVESAPVQRVDDQAVAASYTVSGSVWGDYYGDGEFSPEMGDEWAEGIEVQLVAENGSVLQTVVTDGFGRYAFENLEAGTYRLRFQWTEWVWITEDLDDEGYSEFFELGPDQPSVTFDLPFMVAEDWPNIFVGTYYDADRDGIADDNEPGAPGVDIEILAEDGTLIATTTSDEIGVSYGQLHSGNYRLRVAVPDGYVITGAERFVVYDFTLENAVLESLAIDADGLTEVFEFDAEQPLGIIIGIAEETVAEPAPVEPSVEPAALNPEPVVEAAAQQPVRQLAATGSSATVLLPLAGVVLAAGAVLLRLTRRKPAA